MFNSWSFFPEDEPVAYKPKDNPRQQAAIQSQVTIWRRINWHRPRTVAEQTWDGGYMKWILEATYFTLFNPPKLMT